MSGHTPGPWAFDYTNADHRGGGCWFELSGPAGQSLLWFPYDDPKNGAEQQANACLMVAAPQLLARVQKDVDECEHCTGRGRLYDKGRDIGICDWCAADRALIDLATKVPDAPAVEAEPVADAYELAP